MGLGALRKHKLAAQQLVVLLGQLAPNVLVWSRRWLARGAPRRAGCGIVRLVQAVWAVPGRVTLLDDSCLSRVRLKPEHPRAHEVSAGLAQLFPQRRLPGFLG